LKIEEGRPPKGRYSEEEVVEDVLSLALEEGLFGWMTSGETSKVGMGDTSLASFSILLFLDCLFMADFTTLEEGEEDKTAVSLMEKLFGTPDLRLVGSP